MRNQASHFFFASSCEQKKQLFGFVTGLKPLKYKAGMSAAFLQMASIFSELEKNILRSRVRSGLANAKANGKTLGRRPITKADLPTVFVKYYPSYAAGTMSVTELARVCGLSRPTVYKYIKIVQ